MQIGANQKIGHLIEIWQNIFENLELKIGASYNLV